jgi:hypothetical protein
MTVSIRVPSVKEILKIAKSLPVARAGEKWNRGSLGDLARKSGVYVHSLRGKVMYVGKTTRGVYGNFGERLRRECHEKPARNSFLFNKLLNAKGVRVSCFPSAEIQKRVTLKKRTDEDIALLFERALISVFQPEWNRDVKRSVKKPGNYES